MMSSYIWAIDYYMSESMLLKRIMRLTSTYDTKKSALPLLTGHSQR